MKTILTFLTFALSLSAQQPSVIYQQLFTGTPVAGVSSAVRNNGNQAFSKLDVYLSGAFCNRSGLIYLESSFDNISYVQLGTAITLAQSTATANLYYATVGVTGAYPYVRARYVTVFNACTLNVYYTGTPTGAATSSQPFTAISDNFSYTWITTSLQAGGTGATCPATTGSIAVYSIVLTAIGGDNTIELYMGSQTIVKAKILAGGSLILPEGSRPYAIQTGVTGISFVQSAATESFMRVIYRCE